MKKLTFQQPTGFHQDFIKTYHGIVGKCGAAMAMKHGLLENRFIYWLVVWMVYSWENPKIHL